jgi:hypothetical protein
MTEEKVESVESSNWKVRLANKLLAEKDEKTSEAILQRLMKINIILTFLSLCFVAGDTTASDVSELLFGLI